jgi:integrase
MDYRGRHYRRADLSGGAQGRQNLGQDLTPGAVLQIVQQYARAMGLEKLAPHDMRRTCAKLCRKRGGDLEQIKFLLGHASILQ